RGDAEDPAARGSETLSSHSRSGLKDLCPAVLDSVNRVTGANLARISGGGENHADRRLGLRTQTGAFERAGGRAQKNFTEVAVHAMHQRLRFGVAQTDVELENLGAVSGHHQAGVKKSGEAGGS